MKILVGSKNPVKIEATREALQKYSEDEMLVEGIAVDSEVSDQPIGQEETFNGAKNRALALKKLNEQQQLGADYFVGIEGGISKDFDTWLSFSANCILDREGHIGLATSPKYPLPEVVVEELLKGTELGDVMDKYTGEENTKQKGGAIEYFSNNVMDRKQLYIPGLITAFIPFVKKDLYKKKKDK